MYPDLRSRKSTPASHIDIKVQVVDQKPVNADRGTEDTCLCEATAVVLLKEKQQYVRDQQGIQA